MWVRNMYTGVGGGMFTGVGGGMYTGPGGGMYTGPDSSPYMAKHPAWPIFSKELRKRGMIREATIIENALRGIEYRM